MNQQLRKHISNKNFAFMCICIVEAKTSSPNRKRVLHVS